MPSFQPEMPDFSRVQRERERLLLPACPCDHVVGLRYPSGRAHRTGPVVMLVRATRLPPRQLPCRDRVCLDGQFTVVQGLKEARLLQQIDRRSGANEVVVAGDDDTYVGKVPAGVVTSPDDDVSPPVQLCRQTVPGGMICHPGFSRLARNCSVICSCPPPRRRYWHDECISSRGLTMVGWAEVIRAQTRTHIHGERDDEGNEDKYR